MLNELVVLVLAADHFWLPIEDSDILLWLKGLALGYGLDVTIDEPDVLPRAVQGFKADALMQEVFGSSVFDIRLFALQNWT